MLKIYTVKLIKISIYGHKAILELGFKMVGIG